MTTEENTMNNRTESESRPVKLTPQERMCDCYENDEWLDSVVRGATDRDFVIEYVPARRGSNGFDFFSSGRDEPACYVVTVAGLANEMRFTVARVAVQDAEHVRSRIALSAAK
jgi:hypothetical protein